MRGRVALIGLLLVGSTVLAACNDDSKRVDTTAKTPVPVSFAVGQPCLPQGKLALNASGKTLICAASTDARLRWRLR